MNPASKWCPVTKILVAGGAGFIGSHLTRHLCDLGHKVAVLDAFRPYASPTHPRDKALRQTLIAAAALYKIDLLDRDRVDACFVEFEPEVVINLAADPIVASADRNSLNCERDIVQSTGELSNAITATRFGRRLVQVSSSMVYGNFLGETANEASPTEPINAYGRMKLAAEAIVQSFGARGVVETVIVRPMAVYGPGDHYDRVVPKFCSQCLAGEPLVVRTGADSLIDFSYIGDIVEGLTAAATEPAAAGQIFNLSYGEARSVFDLVSILQTHFPDLRYDISPAAGPTRPNRGALDISKARRLLGYRPAMALDTGIAHCIAHLRDLEAVGADALDGLGG